MITALDPISRVGEPCQSLSEIVLRLQFLLRGSLKATFALPISAVTECLAVLDGAMLRLLV